MEQQAVALDDSNAGAHSTAIHYTTNESMPTTSSAKYQGPIAISKSETIQAIATAAGYTTSAVGAANYTINIPATATPTFSPAAGTYTSVQSVAISDSTPSSTIYYTTNGSTPTTSSTRYKSSIKVTKSETIQAIATATGYTTSAVASATYAINLPATAAPTFSPAAGTFSSVQSVAISDTTPSSTIYYTTNGSTPTTTSAKYQGPAAISKSETLQAIATAAGYTTSAVASATYTINLPATAAPAFSPTAGTYTSVQSVAISDSTPSATIYYTTDGTAPTTASTPYTGAIAVSSTQTIKAIATATGFSPSAVVAAAYIINLPPPTFALSAPAPTRSAVSSGGQGSVTLTVTPQNGFNAAVTFACSGLPTGATCSFSPSSVTPSGGSAITTQLTIAASASASAARPGHNPFLPAAGLALAGCLLAFTRRRALRLWLVLLAAIAIFGALSACGGGGGNGGGGGGNGGGGGSQSTTSTVTVTANSGAINQSTQITLTQEVHPHRAPNLPPADLRPIVVRPGLKFRAPS